MKRMKRWLGIMMSVMLAAGSLQMPVYAAETGETAVEAAVDSESTEIADSVELDADIVEEEDTENEMPAEGADTMDDAPLNEEPSLENDIAQNKEEQFSETEESLEDANLSDDAASEEVASSAENVEKETIEESTDVEDKSAEENETDENTFYEENTEITVEKERTNNANIYSILNGKWVGSYIASENDGNSYERDIVIHFYDYDGNKVYGVFEYTIIGFKGDLYGSYCFEGSINHSTGDFTFQGKNMIVDDGYYNHSSYSTYKGNIDYQNGKMTGSVGSNKFTFTQQGETESNEIDTRDVIGTYYGSHYGNVDGKTVLRNSTLKIETCSNNGAIKGQFEIYPIDGAQNQITGVYAFSGYVDMNSGGLVFMGTEWIQFPDVPSDYTFQRYIGKIDVLNGVISGTTTDGDFRYESSTEYNHFFILGEDSNQFIHYGLPYEFDDNSIKNKLYISTILTWDNTIDLYRYLDGKTRGVCHGIALSMCYGNQGFIDFNSISQTATNYWQLGDPRNNSAFKDVLLYYQLTQLSKGGGATKRVDKGGWHIKSLGSRLNEFLIALVNEAKKSSTNRKPFVLGFKENGDGHSVVVCGYIWNEETRNHEIIIYDENSFNGQTGDYCIMSVPEDCQSFEFADANAEFGGYTIQDVWSSLEIYGIDSIYGSSNILKRTVESDNNETTTFKIPAGKAFRIEDGNGKWISFDGSNYLGNMTVYDCYISGLDDDPYWNITIDSTSKLILTDFEQEFELITQIEGRGYAVSTSGAESIVLQPGSVTAEGSSYSLDVSVQSEEYDILQVQTNAKGITTVKADNEVLTVSSTEKCDDVKAWVYDQLITTQHDTYIDENGDVIIDFENNNTLNEITPVITLSPASFVYNGKVQKPTVMVRDGNTVLSPSDYTVNWPSGCTNAGTYQVSIILKGNYSGMATESFIILPGKTTRGDMFNLANNVKVTWKEVPGAKYYKVYREGITDKKETQKEPVIVTERLIGWDSQPGLTNGHAYRYKIVASLTGKGDSSGDSTLSYSKLMYRLKTVVIRSVKNTAPGKVTVKYDKTTSGDSYVLQYCERQDMVGAKTKVVLGANNTSYVIGGLKKGKTYYISIRVRKKVNGIDYYTTFGVPKKITITK